MLTAYQKSNYLSLLNSTMILRSIGTTLELDRNARRLRLREFKISLFEKIEALVTSMATNEFSETVLIDSITALANEFSISIGQAQKGINVILKYHYYFFQNNEEIKKALHCPIDSKILRALEIRNLTLKAIDLNKYNELQDIISDKSACRLDFDEVWDRRHLEDEGLWYI